jgi:nitrous oxide reductase accessory protein NosL
MIVACHRKEMCARCHMVIAPGDLHAAEIVWSDGSHSKYDSALCATELWQTPPVSLTPNQMHVHEYYGGEWIDSSKVVFVQGSDVKGPMGDEFVAVDPMNVDKFKRDHGGTTLTLKQWTISNPQPQLEK